MKRFAKRFSGIVASLTALVLVFAMYSHTARAQSWSFVDGGGTTGLNYDTGQAALFPGLIEFDGALYAFWSEKIGATSQVRLKKYVNGVWESADNDAPLNKVSSKDATTPRAVVFNNELYVAWQETSTYVQVRVKKFNGTTWSFVDGDGVDGLNSTNTSGRNPKLVVYNSKLYVVFDETGGNGLNQMRVKRYDGGSSWTTVDGGTSLNKQSTQAGQGGHVMVYKNKLYVTWTEGNGTANQVRVKAYDGSSWSFVDGNGVNGMNIDPTLAGTSTPYFAVYGDNDGELYLTWAEKNGVVGDDRSQIRVTKYNGTSWTRVDTNDDDVGINQNSSRDASAPRLAVFDGNLYVAWQEGFVNQIRVKKYDGNTWESVDGDGANGLNYSASSGALQAHLEIFDSALYVVFVESASSVNQIRVKVMGPSNQPPKANNVSFTGTLKEGHTLTGSYEYADDDLDAEATPAFKWYTATSAAGANKTAIAGATASTLALTANEAGKYIIFEVTPKALTGTLTGAPTTYTSATVVEANAAPTASNVSFTGSLKEGHILTGTYTYQDAESEAEGTPVYQWYTATSAAGANKTAIVGATTATLALTSGEVGKYIIFEVTPTAQTGTLTGAPTTYTSAAAVEANAAPTASNVSVSGLPWLNQTLTGSYTYADNENEAEAASAMQWYTADDASGLNKTAIPGATSKTLVVKAPQYGKYLIFEVTPAAASGTPVGIPVSSFAIGAVGVLKGDANGDGLITPADALIVNKHIQGKLILTAEQLKALDMDGDNDVDADDSKLILDIYLGKGV